MAKAAQVLQRLTEDAVGKRAPNTYRGDASRELSKAQEEEETRGPGSFSVVRKSSEKKPAKTGELVLSRVKGDWGIDREGGHG